MAKRARIPLLAALAVVTMSLPAQATVTVLTASLDCSNVTPSGTCASGGSGTGTASVTFDDATNPLSWNVTWAGLSAPVTAAHFHGPASTTMDAGIQQGISTPSPSVGSATLSAGQATDLLAEMWYLNIHSTAFTGGEIRGQVLVTTPTPLLPPALLLVLGGAALLALYRLRRSGSP